MQYGVDFLIAQSDIITSVNTFCLLRGNERGRADFVCDKSHCRVSMLHNYYIPDDINTYCHV